MPVFVPPSPTTSDDIRSTKSDATISEESFRSATNLNEMEDNMELDKGLAEILRNMEERDKRREIEMEGMREQMRQMLSLMKPEAQNQRNEQVSSELPTMVPSQALNDNEKQQFTQIIKPIKWPEVYTHTDQNEWPTTHGILLHIYERDVVQRKIIEPSDFTMRLFNRAVSGTAKSMITGQFQTMMAQGKSGEALQLLKAMDDTFRDRNAEQKSAALFYACRQFRDESLSSFLPRFQQLLSRSPMSLGEDVQKVYQLHNSLNQVTRNYLVGRAPPNVFRELVEFLSALGSQIEEVGLIKTKFYSIGQKGTFDDGTRGIAGGKLLGANVMTNPHLSTPHQNSKDAEGDTIMTGVNRTRATWVSKTELQQRRIGGLCLRCGKKGHRIDNCRYLPAIPPETSMKVASSDFEQIKDDEASTESLKY